MSKKDTLIGIRSLLFNCAGLSKKDRVCILSDPTTSHLGEMMKEEAALVAASVNHQVLKALKIHGEEPTKEVADMMFNATTVFCLTKMSMAHTQARLNANNNNVKYFSLPDFSEEVMSRKALLVDFRSLKAAASKIAALLTSADTIRIITKAGTDLKMDIKNRKANPAPGFCYDDILLASPPDAETNVAPNEFLTNGTAVIDGSIPCREIGLLVSPIRLEIRDGFVTDVTGEKSEILNELFNKQNNPRCRIVAEFGIGLNRMAEVNGSMLEDEGALGTVHLGIGSNKTIGGLNELPFHLDHIIRNATVLVDDYMIMENGVFIKDFSDLL